MSVKTTFSATEVCDSYGVAGSQVTQTWYIPQGESMRNGLVIYTDAPMTQKLQANKVYGASYNGVSYSFSTNSNSEVINLAQCVSTPPVGQLSVLNQFATGLISDSGYQFDFPTQVDGSGNVWNNLTITVGSNNKLTVVEDLRGWYGSGNLRYIVESSNNFLTKAQLEAIDFSNQKGEDVLILAVDANTINNEHTHCGWTFVHIKGDSSTPVPSFLARNPNKRMPQMAYSFPNVTLPANKQNVIYFRQTDDSGANEVSSAFLQKGWSIGKGGTGMHQFVGIYDEWIRQQVGNPIPYHVTIPSENKYTIHDIAIKSAEWLRNSSMNTIYNAFTEVINAGSGKGFLFLDWEYIGFDIWSQDVVNKLTTLFQKFYEANPNTMFTSYIHANPFYDITQDPTTISGRDYHNAKFNKTLSQLAGGFFGHTGEILNVNTGAGTGVYQIMGKHMASWVGIYNYTIKKTVLYNTIQEFELMAKFEIEAVSLNWSLTEGLGGSDFDTWPRRFKKSNGQSYYRQTKPPCQPSHMRNMTILSNFFGKGTWFWDEPLPFMEGYDYWGSNARDINDQDYLGVDFVAPHSSSMHFTSMIGYDYATRGLYELSFSSDIIGTGISGIIRPEFSTNGGTSYYTGNDLLPASAQYLRIPIVRMRKHPTLNEWVLVAVTMYQNHWENQTLKVKIADKTIDVVLKGLHCNLSRIKLI
jgi:hypothetical protein